MNAVTQELLLAASDLLTAWRSFPHWARNDDVWRLAEQLDDLTLTIREAIAGSEGIDRALLSTAQLLIDRAI
ncbi:hypothetical protein C5E44_10195 [Nocardia nova]|uniref:hypothetical protein n=1 Tax=Nocardia nova TaxID=37330 RepID=UPI000CEA4A69|nr:hypothetical protein C5E44_10195 [Nocardia nova]